MLIDKRIHSQVQMSESLIVGSILALSGGYMDAYTYLFRDGVFANAQTGNMILFGIHLSEGNLKGSLRYFFPVISFVLGVFLAQLLRMRLKNSIRLHWRQIAVALEIIVLSAVAFLGTDLNLLANSMVSFACGIQVQSFRKIHGNSLATTMCIGNIRSATDLLCTYLHVKEKQILFKSLLYYGIILIFIAGAVLGNIGIKRLNQKAVLFCPFLLMIVFVLMLGRKQLDGE